MPVVAFKSYFGNLGPGGAMIELAASLLALTDGVCCPRSTTNGRTLHVLFASSGRRAGRALLFPQARLHRAGAVCGHRAAALARRNA